MPIIPKPSISKVFSSFYWRLVPPKSYLTGKSEVTTLSLAVLLLVLGDDQFRRKLRLSGLRNPAMMTVTLLTWLGRQKFQWCKQILSRDSEGHDDSLSFRDRFVSIFGMVMDPLITTHLHWRSLFLHQALPFDIVSFDFNMAMDQYL